MVAGLAVASCAAPQPRQDSATGTVQAGAPSSAESAEEAVAGSGAAPRGQYAGGVRPVHTVRTGDTLYSIAWRYGVDVRDLVAWNSLADPNLIRVGQRLYVAPGVGDFLALGDADNGAPGQARAGGISSRAPASSIENARAAPWRWPVDAPAAGRSGAAKRLGDGIGIGGEIGTRILAAAPGEVVYAGRGLPLYGNLVIVRHDAAYLSAYGHNDTVLVEEGERVAQGQAIATMGMGPARQPVLHFEIRRDGVPVDPLDYLP